MVMMPLQTLSSFNSQPAFGRALREDEWPAYQQAATQAKEALGVDHLTLSIPMRSMPAPVDTGTGNLSGSVEFQVFLHQLGFTDLQIDPAGRGDVHIASPYQAAQFSLETLTHVYLPWLEEEGLLPEGRAAQLGEQVKAERPDRLRYKPSFLGHEAAIAEAFASFKKQRTSKLQAMAAAFDDFRNQNKDWLEPDALYEVLATRVYGSQQAPLYWQAWPNAQDKTLWLERETPRGKQRLSELRAQFADELDAYAFGQFLAERHLQRLDHALAKRGVRLNRIADLPIGISSRDEWAHQDLFLPGWRLGCQAGGPDDGAQLWNRPVLNPNLLFNAEGELELDRPAACYLKRLYTKLFHRYQGGVRIDHPHGLINPWVFPAGETDPKRAQQRGVRLHSAPAAHPLARYRLTSVQMEAVIEKIVKPAAAQAGDNQQAVSLIFETMADLHQAVRGLFYGSKRLSYVLVSQDAGLPGEGLQPRQLAPTEVLTTGTHDHMPLAQMAADEERRLHHTPRLRENLALNSQESQAVRDEPLAFKKAMLTELFFEPGAPCAGIFCRLAGLGRSLQYARHRGPA